MCALETTSLSSFERTSQPQGESTFLKTTDVTPQRVCCRLLESRVVVIDVLGECWIASDDELTGWLLLV